MKAWQACLQPSNHVITPTFFHRVISSFSPPLNTYSSFQTPKFHHIKVRRAFHSNARRRVQYQEEDEHNDEEYGNNMDIALLESYSESVRNEALLVRAMVDEQEEEILIFKGFSSCLSYSTWSDPSRSILPARAVITTIDRVIGPFDPSNIEYIEKGVTWDAFKSRLQTNRQ